MNENTFYGQQAGATPDYPPPSYPPPNYPPPGPSFQQGGGPGYPRQNIYPPMNNQYTAAAGQPPTHWPLAIISFLMSGLLGGVVAVYFAYQVTQRWQAGNPAGAADASRLAKIWGIVGIVVGAFFFLLVMAGSASSY